MTQSLPCLSLPIPPQILFCSYPNQKNKPLHIPGQILHGPRKKKLHGTAKQNQPSRLLSLHLSDRCCCTAFGKYGPRHFLAQQRNPLNPPSCICFTEEPFLTCCSSFYHVSLELSPHGCEGTLPYKSGCQVSSYTHAVLRATVKSLRCWYPNENTDLCQQPCSSHLGFQAIFLPCLSLSPSTYIHNPFFLPFKKCSAPAAAA